MGININTKNYKIYQLMEFFITKYSFNNVLIKELIKDNETWLFNKNHKSYQIIRISISTLDETFNDRNRIEQYISFVSNSLKIEANFLDIHISKEEVSDNERYPTVCIDTGVYSGIELEEIFPNIKNVVRDVKAPDVEVFRIIADINASIKQNYQNKRNIKKGKSQISLTSILLAINVIVFIVEAIFDSILFEKAFLSSLLNIDVRTLIMLGGNYKTFIIGANEYFRFITSSFLHGGILHLACNMYSLYFIGNYIEDKYGKLKYLLLIILSSLIGSLTFGAFLSNGLATGFSGCMYGLFIVYLIDLFKNPSFNKTSVYSVIMINIIINFMANVAWQVHLGGAIAGIVFYYLFEDDRNPNYLMIILCILLIIGLVYKYFSMTDFELYGGTDMQIIAKFRDIGLKDYAYSLENKLTNLYLR